MEISDFGLRISASRAVRNPHSAIRNAGQMLVVVLWAMGLVSLAVGSVTVWSSHELRLGQMPLAMVHTRAIAQAGVQQAIALLNTDDPAVDHETESWATGEDGEGQHIFEDIPVGAGTFSVGYVVDDGQWQIGLIDEERKLNVNRMDVATPQALEQLVASLETAGSRPAADLAAAIADWRDEPIGSWCDEQQLGYPCHNGSFESVEELRLVPGMTPELFAALEPYVTVYGSGAVNVNTADPKVLRAVGVSEPLLDVILQQRQAQQPFTASPDPGNPALTVSASTFTVPVNATLTVATAQTSLIAIIDRAGCGPTPPEGTRCLLAWRSH